MNVLSYTGRLLIATDATSRAWFMRGVSLPDAERLGYLKGGPDLGPWFPLSFRIPERYPAGLVHDPEAAALGGSDRWPHGVTP